MIRPPRGCSSVVERHVANVNVEGSTPFTRLISPGKVGLVSLATKRYPWRTHRKGHRTILFMATPAQTIELPLTLRLSAEARQKLEERAAASGTDVASYVSTIVEQNTLKPLSLEDISGPIYQRFLESGMTDEELSDLLEKEKHEARAQRHARQAS